MNIIPCAEKCIHQKEGYCSYDYICKGVNCSENNSKCLYFAEKENSKALSLDKPDSLIDV